MTISNRPTLEDLKNHIRKEPEPEVDPYRTALGELAPHLFYDDDPSVKHYVNMSAEDIIKSVFPETLYSEEERQSILWGETGFPAFWDMRIGTSPLHVFLRQLWNARARREQQYHNIEILESDWYAGVVEHLKFTPGCEEEDRESWDFFRCRIDIGDSLSIVCRTNGEYIISKQDEVDFKGKINPSPPLVGTTPTEAPEHNPYITTSNVMETFVKFIENMGYSYNKDIPVSIFFKWLTAMAECEDDEGINDSVRKWIDTELYEHFETEKPHRDK